MKIRLRHLTIAMLATAATVGAASANPRMGGVVMPPVNVPRVSAPPINHGATSGAVTSATQSAARSATQGAVQSATQSAVSGATGGGGIYASFATAAAGGSMSGAPKVGSTPQPGFKEIDTLGNDSDRMAETMIIMVGAMGSRPGVKDPTSNSASATTKVASTGPTTATTPTAAAANRPGDPPDPQRPLTQAEHQAAVDKANAATQNYNDLSQRAVDESSLIAKVGSGSTLTDAEQKVVDQIGKDKLQQHYDQTIEQRDAAYKDQQTAIKEAKKNDSYKYVR